MGILMKRWLAFLCAPKSLLIAVVIVYLMGFGVFPIGVLVLKAFQVEGGWGLDNFVMMYADPANLRAISVTIQVALLTTLASLFVTVPLAWLIVRTNLPARSLLRTLVIVPYMVPPYVGAIAWTYLANPHVGYLNLMLRALFGQAAPTLDVYGIGGIIWVQAIFYFPLSFLAVSHALQNMDPTLEEAARISGASGWRTLRDVTLPLMAPSIIAGGLLVFVVASATFGVPAIIGLPAGIQVVTTRIVRSVYIGTPQALRQSTAMAVALMVMALGILALANWFTSKRRYTTITGGAGRLQASSLGRWRLLVAFAAFGAIFVFTFLPLGSMLLTTFARTMAEPPGPANWTLENWQGILTHDKTWNTLRVSLTLAVITATLGLIMGFVIAYLKVRGKHPLRHVPDWIVTFTNSTPSVVVALGLIIAFSGAFGLNLYGTLAILVVAYLARMLAYAVRTIHAALEQIHPSLEEAAFSCGASWLRTVRDVTIPLLGPALIGAWFLIFIRALYELTMSVLLYSATTMTAGVYLYDLESYADPQSAAVLSSLILILVLGSSLLMRWATKGKVAL